VLALPFPKPVFSPESPKTSPLDTPFRRTGRGRRPARRNGEPLAKLDLADRTQAAILDHEAGLLAD
jgi:hypothetical protein